MKDREVKQSISSVGYPVPGNRRFYIGNDIISEHSLA